MTGSNVIKITRLPSPEWRQAIYRGPVREPDVWTFLNIPSVMGAGTPRRCGYCDSANHFLTRNAGAYPRALWQIHRRLGF